ncbi:ATP-binding protein [Paraburkholderia fungorum]|uniref:sensor histidine kinase n=1 Tax=Paraburkholderia TaxID=1822464 RepID=UPI0038BA9EAB
MVKDTTGSRVYPGTEEIIRPELNSLDEFKTKLSMFRGLSPALAKILASVLTVLIFGLDYYTPGDINLSILYAFVVVTLAWTRSVQWLWGGTAALAVLAVVGMPLGSEPVGHPELNWVDWINRCITAGMLIVTAGFVHVGIRVSRHLEASEQLLAEVAARQRAEESLRRMQADFSHVARISTLGELTASIAHELKQPLAAVITNGEAGLRWLDHEVPNVAEAREASTRIIADAQRCTDIIDSIRAMAVPRAPEHTLVSLDELIDEALAILRPELQQRGVTVSHQLAPGAPRVLADRIQVEQVIVNLTVNAMQAMEHAESPGRKITIRMAMPDAATVCCAVEDSGPGIAPEHLDRIFKNFFTTKENGMGLGLPICRSIIEAHRGRIAADNSSVHGGARVCFTLPAADTIG